MYNVNIKKRALKSLSRMPLGVAQRFKALVVILGEHGPTGPHDWQNYSKLGESEYHCHLAYHWVACWRHEKGTINIEVYYAGSREDAPY